MKSTPRQALASCAELRPTPTPTKCYATQTRRCTRPSAGKARYVVFDESMRRCIQRRLKLENDLRKAIGTEQLSLAFQPIVSLAHREIYGVEALLRWHHPIEGMIGPAEFIPVAEECDLIHTLGDWVLGLGACKWQNGLRRLVRKRRR